MEENRYKKLREDFEFKKNGYRITAKELSEIFSEKGYNTLTHSAIRKLETGKRGLANINELVAYAKFFNVTADYLLGIRDNAVVNENIAMIGRTTGLSDDAISTLKKVKGNWNDRELRTLNFIMKNSVLFLDFLKWLSVYIDNQYTIPVTYTNDKGHIQCGYTVNGENGIEFGKKTKDNKGNDGYETLGVGVDILESHAMLKIQKIMNVWKKLCEKQKGND